MLAPVYHQTQFAFKLYLALYWFICVDLTPILSCPSFVRVELGFPHLMRELPMFIKVDSRGGFDTDRHNA